MCRPVNYKTSKTRLQKIFRDHHKEWLATKARIVVRRQKICDDLGNICGECGSLDNLELHHLDGKNWDPVKMSPQMRIKQYELDHSNGQIGLLCKFCNSRDGAYNKDYYSAIKKEEYPF
jgi:hypothetical protein